VHPEGFLSAEELAMLDAALPLLAEAVDPAAEGTELGQ
jgi:hypothetical protein